VFTLRYSLIIYSVADKICLQQKRPPCGEEQLRGYESK
jgi:hypothetical protein